MSPGLRCQCPSFWIFDLLQLLPIYCKIVMNYELKQLGQYTSHYARVLLMFGAKFRQILMVLPVCVCCQNQCNAKMQTSRQILGDFRANLPYYFYYVSLLWSCISVLCHSHQFCYIFYVWERGNIFKIQLNACRDLKSLQTSIVILAVFVWSVC